jgi:DNA-binding protein H-NS
MATISELRAQAEALLKQAQEQEEAERKKLFDSILKKLADAGFGLNDLNEHAKPSRKNSLAGTKVEPKFRSPAGEEWTGRGHQPQWLKDALATGKRKEDFLIK